MGLIIFYFHMTNNISWVSVQFQPAAELKSFPLFEWLDLHHFWVEWMMSGKQSLGKGIHFLSSVFSRSSKSQGDLLFLLSSHLTNSISYPYLTLHVTFYCLNLLLLSISSCFWSEFSLLFCIFPLFLLFLESSGQSILNLHPKSSWQVSKL